MKNANISRLGGFTLIELLVVVLIIGILAAVALPEYGKAVERSRMTEAITLMDSVVKAQRLQLMQTNRYARDFEELDVAPKGATGREYYTKGDPRTGRGGNGVRIRLYSDGVGAVRDYDAMSNPLKYVYQLERYYQSDNVTCVGNNQAGEELCADFCGIDTPILVCCDNGTRGHCPRPANN